MADTRYIACDLGAESGRVILGTLEGGKLQLEELHRFPTGSVRLAGRLRWNILGIFQELRRGMQKVAEKGASVASVSVDSWGVDYVLFNERQPMLALPYHYRDSRNAGPFEELQNSLGREAIYAESGIQFLPFNTIYQLVAEKGENPDVLEVADGFLTIADYLNFLMSGVPRVEVSLASTSQIYNPVTQTWSEVLIEKLGLPREKFPEIVPSGTVLGPLTEEMQAETGLGAIDVIAGLSHDTGAAVAAVPGEGDDWAYLSSGTWSLIGVELPEPQLGEEALRHGYTNEIGVNNTARFLKNIIGLWLLQESRRAWEKQGNTLDYAEINRLAEEAEPLRSLINPNDPRFLAPDDMPETIAGYCRETGQPVPETPGQFARCILESLALLYAECLEQLEELTGRGIKKLHIVGGGSQSGLLNRLTADLTGRTVIAGPVEATAIGNVMIQALALGQIGSVEELRRTVRESFEVETIEPQPSETLQGARERFAALVESSN